MKETLEMKKVEVEKKGREIYKDNVYRFKDSEIGESWMLGDDSGNLANAYISGSSACPKDITVPRNLTNEEGVTKPVEVIGQSAYYTCGHPSFGPNTRSVFVTKQVKIIKKYGFGYMHNVESFLIEEGSVLESIEEHGLHWIGFDYGMTYAFRRKTLTLPSTLYSVAKDGFRNCNLFNVIIYCGSYFLNNSCELENGVSKKTEVKVTVHYSAETIFGRTAIKDLPIEVEGYCTQIEVRPTPSNAKRSYSYSSLIKNIFAILLSNFLLFDMISFPNPKLI